MKRIFLVMAIVIVTVLQVSAQGNNCQMTAQQRTEQRIKQMSQTSGAIYHTPLQFDFQANYNIGNRHFELMTRNLESY